MDAQPTGSGRYGGAAAATGGSFNSNFNTHRREYAAILKNEKRGPSVCLNVNCFFVSNINSVSFVFPRVLREPLRVALESRAAGRLPRMTGHLTNIENMPGARH